MNYTKNNFLEDVHFSNF